MSSRPAAGDNGSFSEAEVRAAYENFVAVGDSGDWNAWADLHTIDGIWLEHHLGRFEGREAIRKGIVDVMTQAPVDMRFPVEWAMFDGNRVVFYPWQVLPHPTGGEDFQFGCVTILEYAGDGQFSYQEDLYNPKEGEALFGAWIAAGGVLPGMA
jgi:ketosteroid isomerase-like protein